MLTNEVMRAMMAATTEFRASLCAVLKFDRYLPHGRVQPTLRLTSSRRYYTGRTKAEVKNKLTSASTVSIGTVANSLTPITQAPSSRMWAMRPIYDARPTELLPIASDWNLTLMRMATMSHAAKKPHDIWYHPECSREVRPPALCA